MPPIALLNYIKSTGFELSSSIDHHPNHLRRQRRLVLFSNHKGGGNVAPSGVRLGARVDAETLVGEFGCPVVCFGGEEIVVEDLLCVVWVNVDCAFLGFLRELDLGAR